MPDSEKISRYAKATAKPGRGGDLSKLLLDAADTNRAFDGCLQYEVHQSIFDPDTIWVTESWVSHEAAQNALDDPVNKERIAQGRDLIDDIEVVELISLGGIEARLAHPRASTPDPGYTLTRIEDIDDSARSHGLEEIQEARFATGALGTKQVGVTWFRIHPNQRQPFGHVHDKAEEVYYVVSGSGRVKLDEEILDLSAGNLIRVGPEVTRCFEAGPDGMVYYAAGQHISGDGEIKPGWWTD